MRDPRTPSNDFSVEEPTRVDIPRFPLVALAWDVSDVSDVGGEAGDRSSPPADSRRKGARE